MEADERTHRLLEEIRDAQREHLAEYQRVTQQSLELQQRIVGRQEQLGRIYKRMLLVGGVLVAGLLALLLFLITRWSRVLFR
jgi:cytochrome c-type biogenesis protein CcmH/NrfG